MFDEIDRLRDESSLFALLQHYADLAAPDRQTWLDRRMQLDGCDPRQLTRFHGELIAYGWLEQNTGIVPEARPDSVPACYRITRPGIRALEQVKDEQ